MPKKNQFPTTLYAALTTEGGEEPVIIADAEPEIFDDGAAVAVYTLKEIRIKEVKHALGEVIK